MQKIEISSAITDDLVRSINSINDQDITLVLKNTRGQSANAIANLNPKIKVRVVGGLDEKEKRKFDDYSYYARTIYSPRNLSNIIREFEKIEKGLKPEWPDLEKAMYVYKKLSEKMHYMHDGEPEYFNGQDVTRSLSGILRNYSVCSGFALIYKEMMDRIGVPCLYQNQSHIHSWNAIKINGTYYPVDLTWDCCAAEKDSTCKFSYFACDPKFYNDKEHDLTSEREEIVFHGNVLPTEERQRAYNRIVTPKVYKYEADIIRKKDGTQIAHKSFPTKTPNIMCHLLFELGYGKNNSAHVLYVDECKDTDLDVVSSAPALQIAAENNNYFGYNKEHKKTISEQKSQATFKRSDGSSFILIETDRVNSEVNSYFYVDISANNNKLFINRSTIHSELALTRINDPQDKEAIADDLLSKGRVDKKVDEFGGYVGYLRKVGDYYQRHYNPKLELSIGNKVR